MKPKKMIKILKREAKKIPLEEYHVFNKFYRPLFQDAEGNLHSEREEKDGSKRRMVFGVVEKYPVNHGRRVKKLYKQFGMSGVDAYFFVKAGMVQQSRL